MHLISPYALTRNLQVQVDHTNGSAVVAVDAWLLKPPAGFVQCLMMMWRPAILAIPAHSLLSFLHAQLAKL